MANKAQMVSRWAAMFRQSLKLRCGYSMASTPRCDPALLFQRVFVYLRPVSPHQPHLQLFPIHVQRRETVRLGLKDRPLVFLHLIGPGPTAAGHDEMNAPFWLYML